MIKKILLLITVSIGTLSANQNISIEEILKLNFSETSTTKKETLLLTKEESNSIQTEAKAKLNSKIVRLYTVQENTEVMGYGVMLSQKIRTKKATILYMIDTNKSIKAIEIISFQEPQEYKPNSEWQEIFNDKNSSAMLISGKDIPTISGATLSARAITDASRIALAIISNQKQ